MEFVLLSFGFYIGGMWWLDIVRINDNRSMFCLMCDEDGLSIDFLFVHVCNKF